MCNNETLLAKMVGLENLIKEKFKTNDDTHTSLKADIKEAMAKICKNSSQILIWKGMSIMLGIMISSGVVGYLIVKLIPIVNAII